MFGKYQKMGNPIFVLTIVIQDRISHNAKLQQSIPLCVVENLLDWRADVTELQRIDVNGMYWKRKFTLLLLRSSPVCIFVDFTAWVFRSKASGAPVSSRRCWQSSSLSPASNCPRQGEDATAGKGPTRRFHHSLLMCWRGFSFAPKVIRSAFRSWQCLIMSPLQLFWRLDESLRPIWRT